MSRIGLIISREYLTRVKKKTFILMSFLGPLLIVGFVLLTSYLSKEDKDKYEILVIDESHLFDSILRNSDKYHLQWAPNGKDYKEVQEIFKKDLDSSIHKLVNKVLKFQKEDGFIPLVLRSNNPENDKESFSNSSKPSGWYSYNSSFDYLPFLSYCLLIKT